MCPSFLNSSRDLTCWPTSDKADSLWEGGCLRIALEYIDNIVVSIIMKI